MKYSFAKKNNAEATFSFTGDALALYGGSSFDHGDYEVKIDGVSHLFNGGSNGGSRVYHPQVSFSNSVEPEMSITNSIAPKTLLVSSRLMQISS